MLLSALIALAPGPRAVTAPIVAISAFKNGYAVVMRQIEVPAAGDYELLAIPRASLGTLWFAASDGTTLESVKNVNETTTGETDASNLDQVLTANLGKQIRLGTKEGDDVTGKSVEGKLVSVGDVIILQTSTGTLVFPKSVVSSVSSVSGTLDYAVKYSSVHRALVFRVTGRGGHISMVSLERGATWSPAYAVDISDKKKLTLTAKSTLVNDLEEFKNVEARFVTGFPNMEFADLMEPLTSGESVDQFLGFMQSPASGAMGGFGGGGGFGGRAKVLTQNGAVQALDFAAAPGTGMSTSPLKGQQLEDLFFYRQPNVSLDTGERAYYSLFKAEATYKELYTWDSSDQVQNNVEFRPDVPVDEVWHTLQFKNTSGHPLTTAPATTFQNGQVLGQDTLNYTSTNGDAELRVTKAPDIKAESSEEEVSRDRGAIKSAFNQPIFDLVTMKGTLQAVNMKAEAVDLRIRHDYTGDLISSTGDPVVRKTAKGLRDTNPTGRLTWTKTIEPGKTLTLTYSYKVYVRSQ